MQPAQSVSKFGSNNNNRSSNVKAPRDLSTKIGIQSSLPETPQTKSKPER